MLILNYRFKHPVRRVTPTSPSPREWTRGEGLTVTISAALLMGAGVFILVRYAGMRIWHAAVCIIFGFYLASSSLAPDITNIMTSLFRLL